MKTFLKISTSFLLLCNGIGAIYGGSSLMRYPDGSGMHLSVDWLKYTPFTDYSIPGLILFLVNGLFSLFVWVSLLLNRNNYSLLIMVQGTLLLAWIIIQIILMRTVHFLHIILGSVGIALIILGGFQRQLTKEKSNKKI